MASTSLDHHDWPAGPDSDREHLFTPWMNDQPRRGAKKPTQYRTCVHPQCNAVDRRDHPNA